MQGGEDVRLHQSLLIIIMSSFVEDEESLKLRTEQEEELGYYIYSKQRKAMIDPLTFQCPQLSNAADEKKPEKQ